MHTAQHLTEGKVKGTQRCLTGGVFVAVFMGARIGVFAGVSGIVRGGRGFGMPMCGMPARVRERAELREQQQQSTDGGE